MFSMQKKKKSLQPFEVDVMNFPQNYSYEIQSKKKEESFFIDQNLTSRNFSKSLWSTEGWVIVSNEQQPFDITNSKLQSQIEEKLRLIQSGNVNGPTYTPKDYLKHIDEV